MSMENKAWVNTESAFLEWGHYKGTHDVRYIHNDIVDAEELIDGIRSIVRVPVGIEERAYEVRFESHLTRISKFYYLHRHIATYDSRIHTLYINSSYVTRANTPGDTSGYRPRLDWLKQKFINADAIREWKKVDIQIIEGTSIKLVALPPSYTKRKEDLCTNRCPHSPVYPLSAGNISG